MKPSIKIGAAFTLVELLVVMAVIGVLTALLFPVVGAVKAKARRATCLSNLRQINLGIRIYCDDSNDTSPGGRFPAAGYKELMKTCVGLNRHSSSQDRLFACPADRFHWYELPHQGLSFTNAPQHEQPYWDYSSYWFNGLNASHSFVPHLGVGNLKISSISEPAKTVLVAETPAYLPYSWHQPRAGEGPTLAPMFNEAKNMISFVDGHVNYLKIYWHDSPSRSIACESNPPAGFAYKWSGD
jgi:prepilin-type N-terminal cleavage/methylation domain-containing protein